MHFSLHDLDLIRQNGFRPTIVLCFVYREKVLLVHHSKYDLWQFPQGGIENGELPVQALFRETKEELGAHFAAQLDGIIDVNAGVASKDTQTRMIFLGRDRIIFQPGRHPMRALFLDDKTPVEMVGKEYLFFSVQVDSDELILAESEFDTYEWHTLESIRERILEIRQPGKQRMTVRAVQYLVDEDLLRKI